MQSLTTVCEGILNGLDDDLENYVELCDRMGKDLKWVQQIKLEDAVYYEAALLNVTHSAFRYAALRGDDEYKRNLAIFMACTHSPYVCTNAYEDIENWEEREYEVTPFPDSVQASGILDAGPTDPRWKWTGSNSFYHYFWDADYIHSLDQEELLDGKRSQEYSKKLVAVAAKYGMKLKPIF